MPLAYVLLALRLITQPNTRFCVWSMSWSTSSASRVVSLSSHAPKFRSNHTVHRRIVSASDDDSGNVDKLQSDPDYQDNQARAQQAWNQRNPDYWREYRASHPKYVERNRALQQERNAKAMVAPIAKMDASTPVIPLPSGIYHLRLVTEDGIAKMDVWTVEITVHSSECKPDVDIAKR